MQVILAGLGGGGAESMTLGAEKALREADWILGAGRLAGVLPAGCAGRFTAETRPEALMSLILSKPPESCGVVVYSGDSGFYSGTRLLLPRLRAAGIPTRVLPGISSVQLLSAALGRPWQGWRLVSAHGQDCDPAAELACGQPVFFLTGGTLTPGLLCKRLVEAGFGSVEITVGERLSYPEERIVTGTAEALAGQSFDPLAVLLAEPPERLPEGRTPGWPDSAFVRDKVPMTKQVVRAAVLAKLAVRPGETVWDVGAGTGSVSVELALACGSRGRVCAVECEPPACELIEKNRAKFALHNLTLTEGMAPAALAGLPRPDAVFVGGSKGNLREIVEAALEANPGVRLCISAIALETLSAAVAALTAHGIAAEVTQVAVSESRAAGGLHLLMANNPTFLIGGVGNG